jgi:hypothetical protein
VSQTLAAWHAICNGKLRSRDASMIVANSLMAGHEAAVQSEVFAQDCAQPSELSPRGVPEDPLEELIEMRYQQHPPLTWPIVGCALVALSEASVWDQRKGANRPVAAE